MVSIQADIHGFNSPIVSIRADIHGFNSSMVSIQADIHGFTIQVEIQARKPFLEFRIRIRLMRKMFRFRDRGSTQNSEPNLSSKMVWPGAPFWKTNIKYEQHLSLLKNEHVHCLATCY